jgi:hypothetical protein
VCWKNRGRARVAFADKKEKQNISVKGHSGVRFIVPLLTLSVRAAREDFANA